MSEPVVINVYAGGGKVTVDAKQVEVIIRETISRIRYAQAKERRL